ncbi:MAG: Ig-like domain-containing protein, partial [candidate division Zixibacteria bacterium]|nr:Ig-like domain-containing protein [candidate division Zixibacteria bacterium]
SELVAITVTNVNQAPVLDSIRARSVAENALLSFRWTGSDPDATIPALTAVGLPAGAAVVDSLNGAASLSWTPTFAQAGVYNVTFIASDGLLADSELVAITVTNVNQAPVLDTIGPKSVFEGAVLSFRIHATDLDDSVLTLFTSILPPNATFHDSGNGAGSFVFNPSFFQSGTYFITFAVQDPSGAIDDELVRINVLEAGNQAPVLAPIGAKSVAEGAHLAFRISAGDPDGTIPFLSAVNRPANSAIVDSGNGAGSFAFDPSYAQAGVYNVTFIASDGALADSEIVAITVTNVNLAPVLAPIGAQSVNENQNLNFLISATDPDSTIPTFSGENMPSGATLTGNGNGTATFNFTPTFFQSGVYNVRFICSDGSLTDSEVVAITVNNVNRNPILAAIGAQSVDEGQNLNFLISATDPDSTLPTFTAENLPANATLTGNGNGTATFNFNPNFTQSGVYNVRFIASDGALADSEIVAITANNVNQPPVLAPIGAKSVAEGAHLQFRLSASDPDATIPVLSALNIPANATFRDSLNGAGSLVFDPNFTQSGVYNVTFIASDGLLADSELVAITVTNVNLAPVLAPIGSKTVAEGAHLQFQLSATDPDGTIPFLSALNVPANATFRDSLNGAGSLVFDPDYTQAGVYNVTFIASDGSLADSEIVAITVTNTNRNPVLAAIGAKSVNEGQSLNFVASATDPDGTIPTLSAENVPVNATFTNNGN